MLLSPAGGHHTNTVHWHAKAAMVIKEGGGFWVRLGGSGKVESEPEPRTQIQGGNGDCGEKKRCV